MMDWTDRHCRYFLRGFSPDALLYTEMITAAAILRGDRERLLAFDPEEHPVALQFGGSEPRRSRGRGAHRRGGRLRRDQPQLRLPQRPGCERRFWRLPDARAGTGRRVRRRDARGGCIPVTVKMRIGVIERERGAKSRGAVARFNEADFEALLSLSSGVRDAGCQVAIVHARKAVLGGLSPKDNREVPPLRYDVVRRLKAVPRDAAGGRQRRPARCAAPCWRRSRWCDGVMLGREAYHRPYRARRAAAVLCTAGRSEPPTREALLERMATLRGAASSQPAVACPRSRATCSGSMPGEPGARDYRRTLE